MTQMLEQLTPPSVVVYGDAIAPTSSVGVLSHANCNLPPLPVAATGQRPTRSMCHEEEAAWRQQTMQQLQKRANVWRSDVIDPADRFRMLVESIPQTNRRPHDKPRSAKKHQDSLTDFLLGRLPSDFEFSVDLEAKGGFFALHSLECVADVIRTKRFVEGISKTILDTTEESPDGEIRVCDAGSGSIPVLSIAAALASPRVRCTALEINPESARIAESVVHGMGLDDQITVKNADVLSYVPEDEFDVVMSETMSVGLAREPLVQIMAHMKQFLRAGGRMLPQAIDIMAGFVPINGLVVMPESAVLGGVDYGIIETTWANVGHYRLGESTDAIHFHLSHEDIDNGKHHLMITNRVHITPEHILNPYDSYISQPRFVRDEASPMRELMADTGDGHIDVHIAYPPGGRMVGRQIV